ncbi:unnamed protein product [Cylicocyclus nassatus]|uniref:Uncharacterized protein n=1 Tax=Cylicocyclus nassatus TaxID=53992 RepID=A0AA36MEQ5_CYLNA|nr:unnamed protein product [Cylicocyclus nassatus]
MWHNRDAGTTRNGRALSLPSIDDKSQGLLRRVASLQFIAKKFEPLNKEVRAFVKLRYKDVAKYTIWPECRLEDGWNTKVVKPNIEYYERPRRVPSGPDPRTILNKAELEDHRSPYLPCTINSVTRSDSEDSSSAESVLEMTRL